MFRISSIPTCAALALLLGTALTGPAAQAQSNVSYVAAIPFAFQMNDATLPAGRYQITSVSPLLLHLIEVGGKHVGYVAVHPGDDARSERAQIRFTRYGNRYFLRDFATASGGALRRSVSRCSVTRGEKQAAKELVVTKQTFTTVALNTSPLH
ncbi:MAG TPA: hypothetical protein VF126_05470 [Acidobacteriaceae bacterium]